MLLKEVCKISANNYQKKDNWSYFNYLDTGSLTKNNIDGFQKFNSTKELPSRAKQKVEKDTILYSSVRPNQEHYGYIDKDYDNLLVSTGFIILEPTQSKVNPKYLYYYITQKRITDLLQGIAQNSTSSYPSITKDDLLDLEIDLPPRPIQDKIANILSNIDNQIERNNTMVKTLQVLAQSIYSRWFNQFEFPNENGLPYKSNGGQLVYNEELKREIPIGWEVKELDSILKESDKSQIQVGEAKQNIGTYPFFTSGEEIVLYKDAFVNGAYCYLNTGGNADVKFFDGKASYSTDTWCISFDEYTYIMKEYLQSIKPLMDKLFFSGSGLKHLQKEAFKKQKVLIPPLNLVLAYNDTVSDCQKQASKIYMQNIELNQLKSKLLPLLINGQLEV